MASEWVLILFQILLGAFKVKKCWVLIMAMKQKCLDLNTKLKVIYLYEVGFLSKREIGRQNGLASSILFTILNSDRI
jgi:hypothetical protein